MSYTLRDVASMLRMPPSRVRSLVTRGVLEPERGARGELLFSFQDLIVLRTAGELAASNVPPRRIDRVLRQLRQQLRDQSGLAGLRITADGDRVIVRSGEQMWDPENGQALLNFDLAVVSSQVLARSVAPFRPRTKELTAHDWYIRGCDLEAEDAEQAEAAYRRAIEIDPAHAEAQLNLGRMLHEAGALADAEVHYRAAATADPRHETAWFNLGVVLEDQEKLDDAIVAYRAALAVVPGDADAHFNLAGVYERVGDRKSAIAHLNAYRRLAR